MLRDRRDAPTHRTQAAEHKFTFKLVWPKRGGTGKKYNTWKQASNPVKDTASKVQGYEALDVRHNKTPPTRGHGHDNAIVNCSDMAYR